MKQKRTISIKDERLRKIRNNFRILFIKMALDKRSNLGMELEEITRDKSFNPNEDGLRKPRRFVEEMYKIDRILNQSICYCPVCGSAEQDMIFNPVVRQWFCVKCYEMNKEFYKHKEGAQFYP